MASSSKIPRDVQDDLRDVMDKKVKLSLKILVKMEIKAEKTENKVLAFTPCRIFLLNAKPPLKVEQSFHFLDIQSIESKKPNQLCLTIDGKAYVFQSLDAHTDEMDHIITHIGISLKHIFPAFPLERLIVKIDVQPEERLKVMKDMIQTLESKGAGPCGGYTTMYQCMCDYHGLPFRDEVEWDVDTIYLSLDTRELRLQDFDHLVGRDLVPIIGALEHNTWFRAINASNVKLSVEACNELIKVMKRNAVIEEVNLSNTGIKSDFLQKFALALISNSGSQLNTLDISNNLLEDRGVNHLLGALKQLPCGLTSLDMSRTGVSTKCLNKLGEVFGQSPNIMGALTSLKLQDNGIKGEDFHLLYNCLAQPNAISYLDLSSTDCALDTLCDPLLRGCPSLTTLKASGTTFTHKRSKEIQVPLSWKQLFTSACCLELVDFSSCRLPAEAVKEMLLGLSANRNLKGVYLDVSSNELGTAGAGLISPCLATLSGVRGLDLSNNGLDAELKSLIPELAKNRQLKQLSLGRNFINIKPRFRADVMTALTQLVQEQGSSLESLSLADSKLKGETAYVINALGSNDTLTHIDISGNSIGDIGARMLAKALHINNKLKKVVWDKNNISVQGFEDVAEALKNNMTVRKMPYPIHDATAALRLYPERTEVALHKIETCLQRNHSPRRFAPDQAFRLQQGFLISSTQQMVDRLVVKVEDTVNALQSSGSAKAQEEDISGAQKLVQDANKSRQLLPSLQEIAFQSQAAGNPVDTHLQSMAATLRQAIEEQMKKTTEEMLKCTSSHCPAVMDNQTFQSGLVEGCQAKSSLPKDFSKGVLETISTDIYNTTSEINLAQAALISDSVLDEVIDSLTSKHKALTTHLNLKKTGLFEDKKEKEDGEAEVRLKVHDENSPKFANKRKSVLSRKTRPQSTMGLADESPSNVPHRAPAVDNHAITRIKENSAANSPSASTEHLALSEFPDLPASLPASRPLEHVTKARPRREKMHRPTRPVVNTGTTEIEGGVDSSLGVTNSATVPPTSPKVPDKKDHKAKKEESPSSARLKHDEAVGGKTESKKWVPGFMRKKEDKVEKEHKEVKKPEKEVKDVKKIEKEQKEAKKSNSFSHSFTGFFKKRGSEDKKRPAHPSASHDASLPTESRSEVDSDKAFGSDVDDGRKQLAEVSLGVVKEVEQNVESSMKDAPPTHQTAKEETTLAAPVAPQRTSKQGLVLPPIKKNVDTEGPTDVPHAAPSSSSGGETDKQAEGQINSAGEQETQDKKDIPGTESADPGTTTEKNETPKLPAGLAKMPGLGALGGKNLLLEMKSKQEKRFSNKPPASPEEQKVVTPPLKAVSETNNNIQEETSESPPTTTATAAEASTTLPAAQLPSAAARLSSKTDVDKTSRPSSQTDVAAKPSRPVSTERPATATATLAAAQLPSPPVRPPSQTDVAAKPSRPVSTEKPATTAATATLAAAQLPSPPVRPSSQTDVAAKTSRPASTEMSAETPAVDSAVASKQSENSETMLPKHNDTAGLPPKMPNPAPRSSMLAPSPPKRPVSVVESQATHEIPTSMTTSTPDFQLEETPGGSVVQRPTPAVKPRPPIMPRPRKRDSAPPPVEESSDSSTKASIKTKAVAATDSTRSTHEDSTNTNNDKNIANNDITSRGSSSSSSSSSITQASSRNSDSQSENETQEIQSSISLKSSLNKQTAQSVPLLKPVVDKQSTPSALPLKPTLDKQEAKGVTVPLKPVVDDKKTAPSVLPVKPTPDKQTLPPKPAAPKPDTPQDGQEGIVYDSATLRMSVKDKIKRLSQASASTPPSHGSHSPTGVIPDGPVVAAKTKAMSLPKNARLPGSSVTGKETPSDQADKEGSEAVKSIPEEESSSDSEDETPVPEGEIMV